jgi:hypothetical protein
VLGSLSSSESRVEGESSSDTQTGVGGVEELVWLEGTLREVLWEGSLAKDDIGCGFKLDVDALGMAGVSREISVVPHRTEVEGLKAESLSGSRP